MKLIDWVLSKFGLARITEEDWERGRVAIQSQREEEAARREAQERASVCDAQARPDPVLDRHGEWYEDRCW